MLTYLIVMAHVVGACCLYPFIKHRRERAEEWVHFTLVCIVAIGGVIQVVFGVGGEH